MSSPIRQFLIRVFPSPEDRRPLGILLAAHALARIIYYAAGGRFDASGIPTHFHFLDPGLLRDRLAESLLHLHMQPPLINAALGMVLKLFPGREALSLNAAFIFIGVALLFSVYYLMKALDIPCRLRLALGLLFVANPSIVLYENWLFYTYPVTLMMALAMLAFVRVVRAPRPPMGWSLVYFLMLGALAWSRPFYHLLWVAASAALLIAWHWRAWRGLAALAAIPLALTLGLYAKNLVLFGEFGASTWMGMNMHRITLSTIFPDEIKALDEKAGLSDFAFNTPFENLEHYALAMPALPSPRGIPALDRLVKASGSPNFNHPAYIEISRHHFSDAMAFIRHRPLTYLRNVYFTFELYFRPTSDILMYHEKYLKVRPWVRGYDFVFGGRLFWEEPQVFNPSLRARMRTFNWLYIIGMPAVYLVCLIGAARRWRRGERTGLNYAVIVICLQVAVISVVGNLLDLAENNRFRFEIIPLWQGLLGVALVRLWEWRQARQNRLPEAGEEG